MAKNKKITAIILSHRRPFNIQKLCETFLKINMVTEVIISNNNPEVNLKEHLNISDSRIKLIDQYYSGPIRRFILAGNLNADYYISLDDDLFLESSQIEHLLEELIRNPVAPHGFFGQTIVELGGDISFQNGVINQNTKVDILNRAYFFSDNHARETIRLIDQTNLSMQELNGPCDDVYLSFSGNEKPITHNIGSFRDCPTANKIGIAQWTEQNFDLKRANFVREILKIKHFDQ